MIVTAITGLILAIFARSAVALARGQFFPTTPSRQAEAAARQDPR